MKKALTNENTRKSIPLSNAGKRQIDTLEHQVDHFKKEKDILLALSDDLTKVRDKNDLIILFKQRIKGLFHITHSIVTLIDYKEETYIPFLLDNTGSPIRSHERY